MTIKKLLISVAVVNGSLISLPVIAEAEVCKFPTYGTVLRKFMDANSFGNIGFSFSHNPAYFEKPTVQDCFKLSKLRKGKSIYFFVNHMSNLEVKTPSFVAVQIVKTYKSLVFKHDRTGGMRGGSWYRMKDGNKIDLPQQKKIRTFEKLSPVGFANIHTKLPFNEDLLIKGFGGYWHGQPVGSDVGSLKRLGYWTATIKDHPSIKIENYLIRFENVPIGKSPAKNKRGIPFNSKFSNGIQKMEVRVYSPISDGFQTVFSFIPTN